MPSLYVNVNEVMERLEMKEPTAYKLIQKLNKELKNKGYITVSGKVPRKYFNERCYLDDPMENQEQKKSLPTSNDEATIHN